MNALTPTSLRRAVFLDKDGTLVEDMPFNVDPDRIRLTSGAAEGMRLLHVAGFVLVVISNQAGVAKGLFLEPALEAVKQRGSRLVCESGAYLAGFYYCPHHPAGSVADYRRQCLCRKPAPGLVLEAAHDLASGLAELVVPRRHSRRRGDGLPRRLPDDLGGPGT